MCRCIVPWRGWERF